MEKELKKHRVIGIRHALKVLKETGLIEERITFPQDASEEIVNLIVETALKFYQLGAETGVNKTIDYFIDEKFETYKRNGNRIISSNVNSVKWQHTFPVQAGYTESKVVKNIRIPVSKLGFE